MHVAGFAADQGFVHLYVAGQLAAILALLCQPDATQQKPCSFLGNSQRLRNLATADTVLGVLESQIAGS